MDRREEFSGEQAVVGHGIEHAGLAQEHDQHDAGEAGQGSGGDQVGSFGQAAIEKGDG